MSHFPPSQFFPCVVATIIDENSRSVGSVDLTDDMSLLLRITDDRWRGLGAISCDLHLAMDRNLYFTSQSEHVLLATKIDLLTSGALRLQIEEEGLNRARAAEIWYSYCPDQKRRLIAELYKPVDSNS